MTIKVLSVFGTRPEAIKMAPVALQLAADPRFESRVCVSGQHRGMVDSVLDLFGIRPDVDLAVMSPGQDLSDVTSRVLLGLREPLKSERPDVVLVHGDTTTCLAASLAAFYAGIPVGHVEAGLRSHDLSKPFPEEMNRRVTDIVSELYFAPTERARHHLLTEGVRADRVHVTGNTVIDALLWVRPRIVGRGAEAFAGAFGPVLTPLVQTWPGPIVLVTGHRRESFGRGFDDLCRALRETAAAHRDWLFVYPVHPNPNVKGPVTRQIGGIDNVVLVDPLDYEPFVFLMDRADVILTDSGGIQEEGPALGKTVLVTRDVTERPEALAAGTVRLVGTDPRRIRDELESTLGGSSHGAGDANRVRRATSLPYNPFGDGRAAARIADVLATRFAARLELVGAA